MSAARFLAEHSREFGRVHVTLALCRECAQHLWCWRRQPIAPQGKPFGRCRRRRRHLADSLQANRRRRQEIVRFLDIAGLAQALAAGIKMPAAWFEARKCRRLAPGKARRSVLRKCYQQLACGRMQTVAGNWRAIGCHNAQRPNGLLLNFGPQLGVKVTAL
jgi:hypothetical protein